VLDYHGDCVALSEFSSTLSGTSFSDPAVDGARDRALAAVAAEDGSALLGAFVHHLLSHAASDGVELTLLERAADLWTRGAALCDELGTIRADLEAALDDPGASGSADRFNAAAVTAQDLTHRANVMRTEIDAFRSDVLEFRHLPPHPRQQDVTSDGWDWGNLILGRRTDAFVRALLGRAQDPQTLAFAVGASASYGVNVAGSAFLGHAVGGPRRSHRHRDRLACNAVGSWLATHHAAAMSPLAMAGRVTFGSAANPALPTPVELLIGDALGDAFDLSKTLPVPDLQVGYRRLVEHLTLLDGFARPAVPAPPEQVWMARVLADPQSPPPSLRPQEFDVKGQDGGGVAVQYGPSSTGSGSPDDTDSKEVQKACGIAVAIIILVDLLQAFVQCVGQWANHHPCTFWDNMLLKKVWEQDPPDPHDPTGPKDPNVNVAGLTAVAAAPQTAQLVWMLFDAHSQIWEAIDRAYGFLAMTGLIYPGHLVTMPLYAQLTSLPSDLPWPHREERDPENTYHVYPTSALEQPMAAASPFLPGALPDTYLGQATALALELWRQGAAGQLDTQNRDLDADRGFGHVCWATGGSIHDDPVDVVLLNYGEQ